MPIFEATTTLDQIQSHPALGIIEDGDMIERDGSQLIYIIRES